MTISCSNYGSTFFIVSSSSSRSAFSRFHFCFCCDPSRMSPFRASFSCSKSLIFYMSFSLLSSKDSSAWSFWSLSMVTNLWLSAFSWSITLSCVWISASSYVWFVPVLLINSVCFDLSSTFSFVISEISYILILRFSCNSSICVFSDFSSSFYFFYAESVCSSFSASAFFLATASSSPSSSFFSYRTIFSSYN